MTLLFGMVVLFMIMYGTSPATAKGNGQKPGKAVNAEQNDSASEPGDNGGVDSPDKPGNGPKSKDENKGKGKGLPDNKPGRDRSPQDGGEESDVENSQENNAPSADPGKPGKPKHVPQQSGCCNSCCAGNSGPKQQPGMKPGKNKPQGNQGLKPDKKPQAGQDNKPGCQAAPGQPDKSGKGTKQNPAEKGGKQNSPSGMDKGKAGFDKAKHREENGRPDFKENQENGPGNNSPGK
jgi:hypothetical protein